jgi:hypothetical protein
MNIPPIMDVIPTNVLKIQLPKYHDNDDPILHIKSIINSKDIDDHKIQYFLNSLKGRVAN